MSHTNSTTNYGLPLFIGTDKPAWLTDVNSAMTDIDTAIHEADAEANTATQNITGLKEQVNSCTGNLANLQQSVTTMQSQVNNNTSGVSDCQTDIGNVASLSTTSKNCVGAINEVKTIVNSKKTTTITVLTSSAVNLAANTVDMINPPTGFSPQNCAFIGLSATTATNITRCIPTVDGLVVVESASAQQVIARWLKITTA
jgi:prefoldin subunit 5